MDENIKVSHEVKSRGRIFVDIPNSVYIHLRYDETITQADKEVRKASGRIDAFIDEVANLISIGTGVLPITKTHRFSHETFLSATHFPNVEMLSFLAEINSQFYQSVERQTEPAVAFFKDATLSRNRDSQFIVTHDKNTDVHPYQYLHVFDSESKLPLFRRVYKFDLDGKSLFFESTQEVEERNGIYVVKKSYSKKRFGTENYLGASHRSEFIINCTLEWSQVNSDSFKYPSITELSKLAISPNSFLEYCKGGTLSEVLSRNRTLR